MNREQLKKYIDLYRSTEESVFRLDKEFGINIWNSTNSNFYNNYNLLLHNLLIVIFGEENVNLLEDYIFDETIMSFDDLCKQLNI